MAILHATPGEVINLEPYGLTIARQRTTTIVKDEDFEAARLVVRAGKEIPTHQVAGAISVAPSGTRRWTGVEHPSSRMNQRRAGPCVVRIVLMTGLAC
jgi:hypothetical protein